MGQGLQRARTAAELARTGTCPVCKRPVRLHVNTGRIATHGPPGRRCAGSRQVPAGSGFPDVPGVICLLAEAGHEPSDADGFRDGFAVSDFSGGRVLVRHHFWRDGLSAERLRAEVGGYAETITAGGWKADPLGPEMLIVTAKPETPATEKG